MSEGFKLEKKGEKTTATFQDVEMLPGGPLTTDVPGAIAEILDAHILDSGLEGKNGFDEFQALLTPKDGKWPDLTSLPSIVQKTFTQALAAERARNPNIDSLSCHISLRVQGDAKTKDSIEHKEGVAIADVDLETELLHFDGNPYIGDMSEYLISFSGPTTVQYLGEAEIKEPDIYASLKQVIPTKLASVSLLPAHLYHFTNYTPHREPMNLDEYVSNETPRLFIRIMFGDLPKDMMDGHVYEG
jgi:hypothetical protein